jgi:hypothetical protein
LPGFTDRGSIEVRKNFSVMNILWQILLGALLSLACNNSTFSSDTTKKEAGNQAGDGDLKSDAQAGVSGKDRKGETDGDDGADSGDDEKEGREGSSNRGGDDDVETEEDISKHEPKYCTADTSTTIGVGQRCPKHNATVIAGNGNSVNYVCCPLPSKDILTGPIAQRSGSCSSDEVIIGVVNSEKYSGVYDCQRINTKKYKLSPSKVSCGFKVGTSHSGLQGATICKELPGIPFASVGADGCSGEPFGSLMTARTQKYCRQHSTADLLYKDGSKVRIFKD